MSQHSLIKCIVDQLGLLSLPFIHVDLKIEKVWQRHFKLRWQRILSPHFLLVAKVNGRVKETVVVHMWNLSLSWSHRNILEHIRVKLWFWQKIYQWFTIIATLNWIKFFFFAEVFRWKVFHCSVEVDGCSVETITSSVFIIQSIRRICNHILSLSRNIIVMVVFFISDIDFFIISISIAWSFISWRLQLSFGWKVCA